MKGVLSPCPAQGGLQLVHLISHQLHLTPPPQAAPQGVRTPVPLTLVHYNPGVLERGSSSPGKFMGTERRLKTCMGCIAVGWSLEEVVSADVVKSLPAIS